MKKILNVITLVMVMGALMFMQSCKKEETGSQFFYATIQQYEGDKVYINEPYSCWEVGDQIRISGMDGTVSTDPENPGRYRITIPETNDQGNEQHMGWIGGYNTIGALYPASLFRNTFNAGTAAINRVIFLEPTQKYEEVNGHQKLLAPMVAVLPGQQSGITLPDQEHTLEFKNVCALLKVDVTTSTPITVTRIVVENTGVENTGTAPGFEGETRTGLQSGRPLWGNFEIAYDGNDPILREESPALWSQSQIMGDNADKIVTKEVTLECERHGEGGVSVSNAHSFYIFLPPVGYDKLHVTVYARVNGQEMCLTKISARNGTFQANKIYPFEVNYPGNIDESWITIERDNTDLLGPYTVDGNGKRVNFWYSNLHRDAQGDYLPPYQYDFIGFHDPNGDHDHFVSNEWLADVLEIYEEIGTVLLSGDEWYYLMYTRSQTYKFVPAVVASVPGIILFPDNFSMPTGDDALSGDATTAINNNKNSILNTYTNTILSIPDFYKLENVGCVFLPCIYYTSTDENVSSESVSTVYKKGYYWENASTRLLIEAGSNDGSFPVANEGITGFLRFADIIEE